MGLHPTNKKTTSFKSSPGVDRKPDGQMPSLETSPSSLKSLAALVEDLDLGLPSDRPREDIEAIEVPVPRRPEKAAKGKGRRKYSKNDLAALADSLNVTPEMGHSSSTDDLAALIKSLDVKTDDTDHSSADDLAALARSLSVKTDDADHSSTDDLAALAKSLDTKTESKRMSGVLATTATATTTTGAMTVTGAVAPHPASSLMALAESLNVKTDNSSNSLNGLNKSVKKKSTTDDLAALAMSLDVKPTKKESPTDDLAALAMSLGTKTDSENGTPSEIVVPSSEPRSSSKNRQKACETQSKTAKELMMSPANTSIESDSDDELSELAKTLEPPQLATPRSATLPYPSATLSSASSSSSSSS